MKTEFNHFKLDYIEEIANGEDEFKKELICIFLKQIPEFISNMKRYLSEYNNEALAKEAHTAKSSVLTFMMKDTGNALKKIQLLSKENNTKSLPALINEVEKQLTLASEELESYLKEAD